MLPRLTIICPVFNEEKVISLFFERAFPVITVLSEHYQVNLLFLNNASTDETYEKINTIRQQHEFVYVITLSRNVGYQSSLECGLRNAIGDVFVFIDVDCEDPPEMLLEFARLHEQGYDLVYGERVDREEASLIKICRKAFYRIVRRVADEDIILYMAEFSLFTAEVRDAMVEDNNSFPFIRSSISRVGFHRIGIPYKRQRRIAGETHYNIIGMTVFAIASILSASTLFLRLPVYLLPFWLAFTLLFGALFIVKGNPWFLLANVFVACTYLGGTCAFVALYVARIYKNVLARPNFVVHKRFTHMQTQ